MGRQEQSKEALTLEILEAIESRNDVTQRSLANDLGVALGLTNAYLKRCVRKGLVKIQQAPANRYLYYLTPKGFAEKSRLTGEYLLTSFDYYHRASASVSECLQQMQDCGQEKILFLGVSELAEIAYVRAFDFGATVIGTYDPHTDRDSFVGKPVWRESSKLAPFDAVMFTQIACVTDQARVMLEQFDPSIVYIPEMVRATIYMPQTA